jgi:hypothetical protein
MTASHKKQLRPKRRKILSNYRGYNFILGDESYFTLSNTTLSGNDIFYSINKENTPESGKNK